MDEFDQMIRLFFNNKSLESKWRILGWTDEKIRQMLIDLKKRDQIFIHKVNGKILAFVAWVYCGDSYREPIINREQYVLLNEGKNVFPVFAAGQIGFGFMRKIARHIRLKAQNRGGTLWSHRHDRLLEFGGIHA